MKKLYKTPIIASIVMLFLALLDLPAGYFTLLRIIVCGTAVYFIFIAKTAKKLSWVWTMGFIAILFNPFIPIQLGEEMWRFIDVVVGFIFLIGISTLSSGRATKFFSRIWTFIKKIYKKELTILGIILLSGFIISLSSVLFPSPRRLPLSEAMADGITHPEYKASFIKVFKYKLKYPEYENISLLNLAEKLAKENIEYQKDYENLKALSKENADNNEFDMVTAVPMFEVITPSSLERILGIIKNYPQKKNIARLGVFIIIFGYPILLLMRFVIWTIKTPKIKSA